MVESEAMVVVGIDSGIARTGYEFVRLTDQGNLETIASGVIETPAGQLVGNRLQKFFQNISELILLYTHVTGAVEKPFFSTMFALLWWLGRSVAMLSLAEFQLKVPKTYRLSLWYCRQKTDSADGCCGVEP